MTSQLPNYRHYGSNFLHKASFYDDTSSLKISSGGAQSAPPPMYGVAQNRPCEVGLKGVYHCNLGLLICIET